MNKRMIAMLSLSTVLCSGAMGMERHENIGGDSTLRAMLENTRKDIEACRGTSAGTQNAERLSGGAMRVTELPRNIRGSLDNESSFRAVIRAIQRERERPNELTTNPRDIQALAEVLGNVNFENLFESSMDRRSSPRNIRRTGGGRDVGFENLFSPVLRINEPSFSGGEMTGLFQRENFAFRQIQGVIGFGSSLLEGSGVHPLLLLLREPLHLRRVIFIKMPKSPLKW